MVRYDGRKVDEGMARHPIKTYKGERILQDRAWLVCGSGGRDAVNGPITVEV